MHIPSSPPRWRRTAPYRQVAAVYNRLRFPRFYALRQQASGMLSPAVYARLYEEIRKGPRLDVLEIGGAAGAGTICIYWAMRESGNPSRLVVVEKFEGGSRMRFGGRQNNVQLFHDHLEHFGAIENIEVFPHDLTLENGHEVIALLRTPQLGALIHDADGRLDRDFLLFWPRLAPGSAIIVDDFDKKARFQPISERYPHGRTKGLLTYRLMTQFIDWGLFEPVEKVRNTLFGRKPADGDIKRLDLGCCEEIRAQVEQERVASLARQSRAEN